MEEGSLRCDANVSLRPRGATAVRHQGRAQEHELVQERARRDRARGRRQAALLDGGERVVQETRLWDAARGGDAVDALQGAGARLPLFPRARSAAAGRRRGRAGRRWAELPELPEDRFARYTGRTACRRRTRACWSSEREIADYFDAAVAAGAPAKRAANWVINEVLARVRRRARAWATRTCRCRPRALAELVGLVEDGHRCRASWPRTCSRSMWAERRTAARHRGEGRAWPRSPTAASWRRPAAR